LRVVVIRASIELRRQNREQLRLNELPVAQLSALLGNINRDTKKGKPFTMKDFAIFADHEEQQGNLPPVAAAVAMQLRHEEKCPPLLLTVWDQVLASLKDDTKVPLRRALRTDDDSVWVLAPSWEGDNIRGGLVLVRGRVSGEVVLRDLDKPLLRYGAVVPERKGFGWVEAGCLLLSSEI